MKTEDNFSYKFVLKFMAYSQNFKSSMNLNNIWCKPNILQMAM